MQTDLKLLTYAASNVDRSVLNCTWSLLNIINLRKGQVRETDRLDPEKETTWRERSVRDTQTAWLDIQRARHRVTGDWRAG